MGEVNLTINGKNYGISCEDGQEQRVLDLGHYVDSRLKDVAKVGAANNENHLFVLTALLLADEVFDLRDNLSGLDTHMQQAQSFKQDEAAMAHAIGQLAERIDHISSRMQKS